MKKIYLTLILSLFALPFANINAQELTKSEVGSVAPQLLTALNSLSGTLAQKQIAFNNQNIALANVAGTLGAVVNVASDLDSQNLSPSERASLDSSIDGIAVLLESMNTYVGRVVEERENFNKVLDGVVSILGEITQTISEAV